MPHKGSRRRELLLVGLGSRMTSSSFAAYWYLHVPSLVVVAMIYLIVMRVLLATAMGWDSRNLVARVFAIITFPVLAVVGAMTPRAVPRTGVAVFAVVWLFVILGVLVSMLAAMGRRPIWM